MRRLTWVAFLCTAMAAATATAQEGMIPPPPANDAMLDAWVGNWTSTGNMMGMATTGTATMEWTLGHYFLMQRIDSTMTMPDGTSMPFQGMGFLKPHGDGTYEGVWLDSMGGVVTMTGHMEGGNMVSEWTDPHMGNARSVMSGAGDTWTEVMSMQAEDGTWTEAGQFTYTRAQ